MNKPLLGVKIALLVANGFSEKDMTSMQKGLIEAGANPRIVSPENGLVNGWDGQGWGHHFAVDAPLSTVLSSDYSVLVIPGGKRSIDKLNLTAHTKRFVTSFMNASKPVIAMDNALRLLILTDNMKGRVVTGPADMGDVVMQAGGVWENSAFHIDENLMTGVVDDESRSAFIAKAVESLSEDVAIKEEAA